jgi:hypothetical protein
MFLILADCADHDREPFRAFLRPVTLKQIGHFMMGRARIGGEWVTISGAYGNDGLPKHLPHGVWEIGVPLPPSLFDAWNTGNGWNDAGSEAAAMQSWATKNLRQLCEKTKAGGSKRGREA